MPIAVFFLFFVLLPLSCHAQDSSYTATRYFSIGGRYNYGLLFMHSKELPSEGRSNPMGYELDFAWHLLSQQARNYCNCYPKLGFSMYYWDYRKPEIWGQGLTLMAFAEPFFNAHNNFSVSIRAGLGLNYQDNPYHPVNNPLNLAYSTYFAYAVLLNASLNVKLSEHLKMVLATNYNHISNGGVKLPNKGLNYPSLSIGMDYSFQPLQFSKIKLADRKTGNFVSRWRKDIGVFLGFSGIVEDDKLYYVEGIFGQFSRQVSLVSSFPFGMEYLYDGADLAKSRLYPGIDQNSANKLSVYTGYEYLLGKLVLSINLGLYLYSPDLRTTIIYQRYGFRFQVFKMIFTGINLKAHGHVADFFDVRLGVSF